MGYLKLTFRGAHPVANDGQRLLSRKMLLLSQGSRSDISNARTWKDDVYIKLEADGESENSHVAVRHVLLNQGCHQYNCARDDPHKSTVARQQCGDCKQCDVGACCYAVRVATLMRAQTLTRLIFSQTATRDVPDNIGTRWRGPASRDRVGILGWRHSLCLAMDEAQL